MEPNSDEEGFLQAIAEEPEDRARVLLYADWLDERGDPRGEFLRLWEMLSEKTLLRDTTSPLKRDGYRLKRQLSREVDGLLKKLAKVRSKLDWNWVARIDRSLIKGCDPEFEFQCPKKWESLQVTEDPSVRFCETCQKNVYYVTNANGSAQRYRPGMCVAISTLTPKVQLPDAREPRSVLLGMRVPQRLPAATGRKQDSPNESRNRPEE